MHDDPEDQLTESEKRNRETFSSDESVRNLYNTDGLSRVELKVVKKYFSAGMKVLDLGCGTGRTTIALHHSGYDVVGVDLSEKMINFAKVKHPDINFRVMNAVKMDFEDESFDAVMFSFNGIDCIHPLAKRIQCLKEIHRVLRPKGIFYYSFHNCLALPRNKSTLKVYLCNLCNLRIFSSYRIEDSPGGELIVCYANPYLEKVRLNKVGFELKEVVFKLSDKAPLFWPLRKWMVNYVVQKSH